MAKISKKTAYEFRACFGGLPPERGTAADWSRLMQMAYGIQNDLVDAFRRHTVKSRAWSRVGDECAAMRDSLVA